MDEIPVVTKTRIIASDPNRVFYTYKYVGAHAFDACKQERAQQASAPAVRFACHSPI